MILTSTKHYEDHNVHIRKVDIFTHIPQMLHTDTPRSPFFWTPDQARSRAAARLFHQNRYLWWSADPISLFWEGDELLGRRRREIFELWEAQNNLISLKNYIHPGPNITKTSLTISCPFCARREQVQALLSACLPWEQPRERGACLRIFQHFQHRR